MKGPPSEEQLRNLEGLFLDCDGVLSDGGLFYDDHGRFQLRFDVSDGLGLAMLCRSPVQVAVISGRPIDVVEARHKELGIKRFVGKARDKKKTVAEVASDLSVDPTQCAYVGDDLPDLGAFAACGLAVAVANAAPEVKDAAQWITSAPGGHGAVREICEAILKARGDWDTWLKRLRGT